MEPDDISLKGKLPFAFRPLNGKQKKCFLCVLSVSSKAGGDYISSTLKSKL